MIWKFPISQKTSEEHDHQKREESAIEERDKLQTEEEEMFQRFNGKPVLKNTNGEIKEPEGGDW